MTELEHERAELVRADRHVAEGEARITRQRQIIVGLDEASQLSLDARRLLDTLENTLSTWQSHRELIMARIRVLEAEQRQGSKGHDRPGR